ncbi:hypothetical protein NE865_00317 [Phthorimaea operculella]|nr:hypothetical protein NE865_00317 [Phthorimaea operculella]
MEKSDENMDKNMEILFSRLEQRLQQQTIEITTTVTNNVMAAFNEKMKIITEENENLKIRVSELENKLNYLDKEKRRNNIILFGMEEKENSEAELVDVVKEIITDMEIHLDSSEISKVSRIGKRSDNKLRPVVATITTTWKKNMIIRNKTKLTTGVYIKEDYSKETLEKRKLDLPKTRDDEVVQKYEELVRDEVATWDVDAPIEEEWGKVKKLLTEVAGTAFGHQKAKNQDWFAENLEHITPLLESKRQAALKHRLNPSEKTRIDLSNAKSALQRTSRYFANAYWTECDKPPQSLMKDYTPTGTGLCCYEDDVLSSRFHRNPYLKQSVNNGS